MLLVVGDVVITMDPVRGTISDGAVLVEGDRIVAVGPHAELAARAPGAEVLGGPGHLILPGLVNAHQHLTGDRLVRSAIPDHLTSDEAIFGWAVPLHGALTPDDDELSATLALVESVGNGITFTVEAGTVAHPERVLAAYDRVGVGGTLGTWGWDVGDGPWIGTVDEVLDRQQRVIELTTGHPRVDGWVTLVGHDLMSDELVVAATALARELHTGLTFHLSPTDADPASYAHRTGRRPLVHLDELGVLGEHVLVAHAVYVDDAELEVLLRRRVAVAYCPWAYLRLGQGVTRVGRHAELVERGGRVALGCDSENAGDAVDVLRAAALAAGLAKDTRGDPAHFGALDALELATIAGAHAVGMGHEIGSLEPGKRADVALVDMTRPEWVPRSPDPVLQLVWASDGRAVRHVVASGEVVVRDGRCMTVDVGALAVKAQERQRVLLAAINCPSDEARSGSQRRTEWGMPDITRLVLLDHETLRRQFADLDDAQASGELSAIKAAWKPLAALLDLHAETEEQVFYPRLLEVGDHAEDEAEDAIDDHNKIRDAVRDAAAREPGSDEWWEAVGRARTENSKHIAEEEREALPDFRLNADPARREELGRRWLEYRAEHERSPDIKPVDKDADAYIEEHAPD